MRRLDLTMLTPAFLEHWGTTSKSSTRWKTEGEKPKSPQLKTVWQRHQEKCSLAVFLREVLMPGNGSLGQCCSNNNVCLHL